MPDVAWDEKTHSCVVIPYGAAPGLREFGEWQPPPETPITPIAKASENVRRAIAQVDSTPAGATFAKLMLNTDYRSIFERGYEEGLPAGRDRALQVWADEYVAVLVPLVNGLLQIAAALPEMIGQTIVSTVKANFINPKGSPVPLPESPEFRKILAVLRKDAKTPELPPVLIDSDEDTESTPEEDAADMLEAAAYADGMQRVPRMIAGSKFWGKLELTYADWVLQFGTEQVRMRQEVVALNCDPLQQGQLTGAWLGVAQVNMVRAAVEKVLEILGKHPELAIPMLDSVDALFLLDQLDSVIDEELDED